MLVLLSFLNARIYVLKKGTFETLLFLVIYRIELNPICLNKNGVFPHLLRKPRIAYVTRIADVYFFTQSQ